MELVKTYIEVVAKHCRDYMAHHGHCEICKPAQIQSALPHMLIPKGHMEKPTFGVLMTQAMVDFIVTIFVSKEDMKGSSVYRVLRMWPEHHEQFGYYATSLKKVDHQAVMSTNV